MCNGPKTAQKFCQQKNNLFRRLKIVFLKILLLGVQPHSKVGITSNFFVSSYQICRKDNIVGIIEQFCEPFSAGNYAGYPTEPF